MSGPYSGPGRDAHQSSCPLTPGRDLSTHSSRRHDHRVGLTMSAAASSLKHASVYRFTQRDHSSSSSSSSSSSYSPLRRLQHLTTMVSQPDLVLPVREPERSWDWGSHKKDRDSWADRTGRDYSGSQITSREESFSGSSPAQKPPEVQSGSRDTPAASRSDSDKKTEGCFSNPPSPAFSLDSNSPFANGLLHFESSLFEDDDNDEERGTVSPIGGVQNQHERPGNVLQSTPGDSNVNSKDANPSSAKVVTRSQSSGQRRRYWDGSEDEWESGSELLLFEDSLSRLSVQQNSVKKKSLPPVKFVEGEVVWAKFSRRPWWPCEVTVDPVQGSYHRVKEPSDRPCRLYYVRTFGEPVELVWVEEKSTHTFHGGFEFEQLHLQHQRGKQREQNNKYTIAKRFQDSWKSSVAEAEAVLRERTKMASSLSLSIDDGFHDSSALERENKAHPAFSPSVSPVPALPEKSHITNGSFSSPVTTPTKPSTLRKSPGKKKQSKSSKDTSSKHSKNTLQNSPDQSDRDNGECPYSDLDSVPKILCPKALERQPKLVPTVTVVKEVKKQPEIQSGLWFSKSGKDRRPKTTSPMPDRTLFSKVPCKKKNSSVVSKKVLVPCGSSSSSGGTSDQSGLSDKHKPPVPAESNLPSEPSGHLKCKNAAAASTSLATTWSPADQRSILTVESGCSKSRQPVGNSADTVSGSLSGQLGSSDVKKASEPIVKVSVSDQSRCLESVKSISRTEPSDLPATKKLLVAEQEKESSKTPTSTRKADTSDSLARLEKQRSLVSKCRLPFVKLIRKDIKDKKFLNSTVTLRPTEQPGCTKKEKTPDTNATKTSSKQLEWMDGKKLASIVSLQSIKVSVKKLKASGASGMLRLSSESSHGDNIVVSSVSVDESGSREAEKIPNVSPSSVTSSSCNQSDQSEGQKTSASDLTSNSSEQRGTPEQEISSVTACTTTVQPSEWQESSVCSNPLVPEGLSPEKSKKVVHKSKQVSDEVNKVLQEQPAHLPASNRLMTRALKAMHEAEQKKREKARKGAEQKKLLSPFRKSEDVVWNPEAKADFCTKTKSLKSRYKDDGEYDRDSFSSCSTPTLMLSDSNDLDVKSEDEDLSISSTPPMDFIPLTSRVKPEKDDHSSDLRSSSSPSSPFSFMNAFKNVEEVSFQSLTNESDGKSVSFKPDANYKFSTFLMMLKDLHDTREREGAPLELEIGPPSAHVKVEPLVMPGEATPPGQDQQIKYVHSHSVSSLNKTIVTHSKDGTVQTSKRPYNRRGSSTGVKKKTNRRVPCRPARSGPGFPGLESPSGMKSLPAMDTSSQVDCSSRVLGLQSSSWERQAGGGVVRMEEEERWSRVKEKLQNMVPLEQRECDATLGLEPPNGLVSNCTKSNLMYGAGGGDKTTAHKRIRKPSKRLIEWTEEYDQIFSTRKKTKKPLQSIGKAPQPVTSASESSGSDKNAHDHPSLNLLPEIQTPPPEETAAPTPSELQIPSTENPSPQDAPVLSIDTLTPPPEVEASLSEGLVKDNGSAPVVEKKRKRKPTQKILEYCLEAEASTGPKKKVKTLKNSSNSAPQSDSALPTLKSKTKPLTASTPTTVSEISTSTPTTTVQADHSTPTPSTQPPASPEPNQVETTPADDDSPQPDDSKTQEVKKDAAESEGEPSSLDHSFSSMKDELSLCDETLSPARKIIGDRGGPASMKENICQVCEKTGELLLCEGQCCGAFHLPCISLAEAPKGKFVCPECKSAVSCCCATTFLPDQFLCRLKTVLAGAEERPKLAAVTNGETSREGGPVRS